MPMILAMRAKTIIFKNKIMSSILLSLTLATIIAFSMPQAEAHTSIVSESSRTQEVGNIIIYVGFIDQFVGLATTTYSVSCDSPATAGIAPTGTSGPGKPFIVKVSSSVAGTFDCTITAKQIVTGPRGTTTHTDRLIVTSTFTDPPPPPIMCGLDTVLDIPTNKCLVEPRITNALSTCNASLATCDDSLSTCQTALAEGTVFSATNVAYNIIIEPGQIVTITDGSTLSGNVFVNGGTLNLLGSTVTGNIETTQAGSIINMQQSSVNGNVLVNGAQSVNIDGNVS